MKKKPIILTLLLSILFAIHVNGQNAIEDYQIYSTILHSQKQNFILISDLTVKADKLATFIDNIETYKKDDLSFKDAFDKDSNWLLMLKRLAVSDSVQRITNKFDSKIGFSIITQKRLNRILGENLQEGYVRLGKKYKDFSGILEFSNCVLNNDKSKAVIYSSFTRGTTGACGKIYFLVKTENGWTILYSRILWFA